MTSGWAAAAALLLFGGVPAHRRGEGPVPGEYRMMLAAAGTADLRGDAIRFSSISYPGQGGYIVELRRDRRHAQGKVVRLVGNAERGYRVTDVETIPLTAERYVAVARQVDALLDEAAGPEAGADKDQICIHEPQWLTERRSAAGRRWLSGFCSDGHPNGRIAALMRAVAGGAARPGR